MNFTELAQRYRGQVASRYDARRSTKTKWLREQDAVAQLLARLPAGSSLLDVPVGTGRFIDLYQSCGLAATGIDVSADMLAEAARKAQPLGYAMALRQGDIRRIDSPDASFDTVLCVRFLNWVDTATLGSVLDELTRVSRRRLILSIRTYLPTNAGQLWSPIGVGRWVLQRAWRVYSALRSKLHVHRKVDLQRLFAQHRLRIVSMTLVDLHGNGTDYNIYLLEKAG